MNNSIQLTIQQVQLIQFKIQEMFHQEYDRTLQSYQHSIDNFNEILNDNEKRFDSDDKQVDSCVQKHVELIKNISSKGRDNVLKCVESAITELDNIREHLTPYMESIKSQIKNIVEASEQCSWSSNQITMGVCVVQNVCF